MGSAPCLWASWELTLRLMNCTSALLKQDCDPVAKSVRRVPTQITKSARLTHCAAHEFPVSPCPPRSNAESFRIAPLPANVSTTGIPIDAEKLHRSSHASE